MMAVDRITRATIVGAVHNDTVVTVNAALIPACPRPRPARRLAPAQVAVMSRASPYPCRCRSSRAAAAIDASLAAAVS